MKTRRSFLRSLLAAAALPFAARLIGGNKAAAADNDTRSALDDLRATGRDTVSEADMTAILLNGWVSSNRLLVMYDICGRREITATPFPEYLPLGPTPPAC